MQAAAGDTAGYQATAQQMREKFGTSPEATTLGFVAWTGLLAPGGVEQPAELLPLVEKAIAASPQSIHGVSKRGVVLYRMGDNAAAERELTALDERWDSYPDNNLNSRAYGVYFLAMARQQLGGNAAAAREALQRANDLAKQELEGFKTSIPWVRWVTIEMLRKEAEALIGKEGAP